ncbi:twin-arginine translocase TatA/TatE family subunit [Desulfobulbus oligotrophicus]|jgi:sec-independent protein translocase protein TatA|uniref:Sec-independent protein translocase protein TatA n=1 Tax=Desulfobulbus oligotrophicus TaxID=1909699 RepID=A0A7T5VDE1_9BACT|nr:twin-arginine translocase TatA/TatE family subunit [Desulfobulbus oligotrophicus]MDY0390458.1 twin-arginine translocase TatA/TatE family subunit [Desulfobulbus oligotrophicus]QQG65818.1 twin-arginine translocase TatA/TatE family subunit [Desulfobulbus oligotrophicus]
MFGLGTPELIVILLIAFVLFGGKKLPEIGAGLGKAIGSFKRGLNEVEEAKTDLIKNLPGAQEVVKVQETIKSAKDLTRLSSK